MLMDPLLLNESSFSAANTFSEIWPFSVNDALQLPLNSGQEFGYSDHKYISAAEDSTVTEQTGGGRKRRALNSIDESSKMLSSCSSVNGLGKKKTKLTGSQGDNEDGLRPEGDNSESQPPKDYIHMRARRGHSQSSRASIFLFLILFPKFCFYMTIRLFHDTTTSQQLHCLVTNLNKVFIIIFFICKKKSINFQKVDD